MRADRSLNARASASDASTVQVGALMQRQEPDARWGQRAHRPDRPRGGEPGAHARVDRIVGRCGVVRRERERRDHDVGAGGEVPYPRADLGLDLQRAHDRALVRFVHPGTDREGQRVEAGWVGLGPVQFGEVRRGPASSGCRREPPEVRAEPGDEGAAPRGPRARQEQDPGDRGVPERAHHRGEMRAVLVVVEEQRDLQRHVCVAGERGRPAEGTEVTGYVHDHPQMGGGELTDRARIHIAHSGER